MTSGAQPLAAVFGLAIPPRHPRLGALRAAADALAALPLTVSAALAPVGVRTEPMRYENGLFDSAKVELGVRIADDGIFPGLTLLHEVGHALDYLVFGQGQGYASLTRAGSDWQTWYAACLRSDSVRRIRNRLADPDFVQEASFAAYLLEPPELFARSFAQWVASRSPVAAIHADISQLAQSDLPQQWRPADFVTLDAALVTLCGAAGGVT
ncbi:hypothetical protein K7W42_12805 [Deinococcus sp. HMF7604]|uniref:hypothetical protein n=1 Tax=Deinococcus betulae TaxID=2873312 RepID=UPI001CCEE46D|nr:hypothetical protein [Deinococcus betulae]MBZ9751739.1 hypothetical protein [Deinococcus betulae]